MNELLGADDETVTDSNKKEAKMTKLLIDMEDKNLGKDLNFNSVNF